MLPMQFGEGNGWNLESNVVLPTEINVPQGRQCC
jgi:hypothetical protein